MPIKSTHEIYMENLTVLDEVAFTYREIDVMACVIHGKGATIPSLLLMAQKTVAAHINNINQKLRCNSREGIISFVEKSAQYSAFKRYYLSLLVRCELEKNLREFASSRKNDVLFCKIVSVVKEDRLSLEQLRRHLLLAGIHVEIETQQAAPAVTLKEGLSSDKPILCVASRVLLEALQEGQKKGTSSKNLLIDSASKGIIWILLDKEHQEGFKLSESCECVDFTKTSYYFTIWDILKKLFPQADLSSFIERFQTQHDVFINSLDKEFPQIESCFGAFIQKTVPFLSSKNSGQSEVDPIIRTVSEAIVFEKRRL